MTEPLGRLPTPLGEASLTGAAGYLDADPEIREPLPRIYVELQAEGSDISFLALVDTGGHYCILNSDVVDQIGRDHLVDEVGRVQLRTAYGLIQGELYLQRLILIAEIGEPLAFEATVFVSPDWRGPSFLGYAGALDRVCFAVNPRFNRFYFGPLE